jgi:dynein light intermediate chain 1
VPITIVCTKADQIDVVAEELGFGGGPAGSGAKGVGGKGGWEERTDWINQVLRLVALMCKLHPSSSLVFVF